MILYESQTHVLWLEFSCPPSTAPRSFPPQHPTNILRFRWAPCHLIFQHRPLLDTLCGVCPAQKPLTLYWEQPSDSPVAFSSHSVGDPVEKLVVWKRAVASIWANQIHSSGSLELHEEAAVFHSVEQEAKEACLPWNNQARRKDRGCCHGFGAHDFNQCWLSWCTVILGNLWFLYSN